MCALPLETLISPWFAAAAEGPSDPAQVGLRWALPGRPSCCSLPAAPPVSRDMGSAVPLPVGQPPPT